MTHTLALLPPADARALLQHHGEKLSDDEYSAFCGADENTRIYWHGYDAYLLQTETGRIEVYPNDDKSGHFLAPGDTDWDTF